MRFIYDLLSAIIIVMSATGLLVDQIKKYQYIVLLVYIMVMVELSSITGLGQIVGLVMAPVLFLILAFFIKNRKIWNLCLGCVGYLLNITFNNLVIYVVSQIGKVSALTMSEKYWLQFSVGYVVLLGIVLYIIRECLIRKRDKAIEETSGMITRGLFINLILFMIVFIINVSMGEQIGYSVQGIKFNIILFAICLMISSILFVVCIKTVKKEEEQKAEEKQLKILEAYIKNLEQLNEKTSAFRHDYKNILSGLSGFLKEGKTEEMTAYLSEIIHATEKISEGQDLAWKELRYVYPLGLKGFLYEKILSAYAQKIRMQIQVDEKLDFKCSYMKDVIRIIGIFIDNAIEETKDMKNGYIIIVAMNTEQGCLFSIANNYKKKPELALMQQRGYTTKGENHGMGLYWAEEMIKKREVIHNVNITDAEVVQEIEIIKE